MSTFNRSYISVPKPDVDYQFFNHNNWKGVCSNKNFLSVDQETFEDANNVYIDADGLLKSRPAIKVDSERMQNLYNVASDNCTIYNVWQFVNTVVYLINDNNVFSLIFFQDDISTKLDLSITKYDDIRLVLADNKIFVFTPSAMYLYDIFSEADNKIRRAEDMVYIPITKVFVDGIASDDNESVLSNNELTTSYISSHIFSNLSSATFEAFIGNDVTVKLNDTLYHLHFVENNELVFVQKRSYIPHYFAYANMLGIHSDGLPLISISEDRGNMICTSAYYEIIDGKTIVQSNIYYSVDGITFTKLPELYNIVGMPKISQDGIYVFAFTENSLNIINVADDNEGYRKYPTWENILYRLNWEYADTVSFGKNNRYTYTIANEYDKNVYCNGYFITDDVFAFVSNIDTQGYTSRETALTLQNSVTPLSISSVCVFCRKGNFTEIVLNGEASLEYTFKGTTDADGLVNFSVHDIPVTTKLAKSDKSIELCTADVWIGLRPSQYAGYAVHYVVKLKYRNNIVAEINRYDTTDLFLATNDTFGQTTVFNHTAVAQTKTEVTPNSTVELDFNLTVHSIANNLIMQLFGASTPNIHLASNEGYSTIVIDNVIRNVSTDADYYSASTYKILLTNEALYPVVQDIKVITDSNRLIKNSLYDSVVATDVDVKLAYDTVDNRTLIKTLIGADAIIKALVNNDVLTEYHRLILSKRVNTTYLLTNDYIYDNYKQIPLLFKCMPVELLGQTVYVSKDEYLYSSAYLKTFEIQLTHSGEINYLLPDNILLNDEYYFSKNSKLYISAYPADSTFKWYFPTINTQEFASDITALHQLSSTEVGIFFIDNIHYSVKSEYGYSYYKSKLSVGCEKGSTIVTSQDGKNIIFSSNRGLVALSYQDFVATTEQTLTYLSDVIYSKYKNFNTGAIKLYLYDYWLICYKLNCNDAFVIDIRNSSIWPMTYSDNVFNIVTLNYKPCIVSNGKLKYFDASDIAYADDVGKIDWRIVSQKLHLNALNYTKRILSFMFASVNDNSNPCNIQLQIKNYRKKVDAGKEEIIEYSINVIRTFVKRVNYAKVSEFQYTLAADLDNAIQVPLSLTNIAIKYLITGVIR